MHNNKMVVRCSRCRGFKKSYKKSLQKNVKEDVADKEDVVLKAFLKSEKTS